MGAVSGPHSLPFYLLRARDKLEALDILYFSAELLRRVLAQLRCGSFGLFNVLFGLEHGQRVHLAALPVGEPVASLETRQDFPSRNDIVLGYAGRVFDSFRLDLG